MVAGFCFWVYWANNQKAENEYLQKILSKLWFGNLYQIQVLHKNVEAVPPDQINKNTSTSHYLMLNELLFRSKVSTVSIPYTETCWKTRKNMIYFWRRVLDKKYPQIYEFWFQKINVLLVLQCAKYCYWAHSLVLLR